MLRLVMLGPPGSGKGTQAVGLALGLNAPHIATGDLFRAEIAAQSELGKLADSFMRYGNLVPDEVVNELMRERLGRPDAQSFLLDGYPRTLEQGRALSAYLEELERPLDAALAIEVPDEAIVERAVGRQVCPVCGAIYHVVSKPPQQLGICDRDRAALQTRDDDKPSTVRHRLGVYHRLTAPLLHFYEEKKLLRRVEGVGTRTEVEERLRAAVADLW
jgi:adenylate kinase